MVSAERQSELSSRLMFRKHCSTWRLGTRANRLCWPQLNYWVETNHQKEESLPENAQDEGSSGVCLQPSVPWPQSSFSDPTNNNNNIHVHTCTCMYHHNTATHSLNTVIVHLHVLSLYMYTVGTEPRSLCRFNHTVWILCNAMSGMKQFRQETAQCVPARLY